jgi:3'5'-cyclic nucleotide phosphodiesterase/Adenylate and Guanylate cyclase catalytic domain
MNCVVNTAARMETSGKPGRIHASQKTADLLIKAGKERWVTKREDIISVKGKGTMVTYWVHPRRSTSSMNESDESGPDEIIATPSVSMTSSLIDWNVDLFTRSLKRLVVLRVLLKRNAKKNLSLAGKPITSTAEFVADEESFRFIPFQYEAVASADLATVNLPCEIIAQLRDFITLVAKHHCLNPFHNFEHTCLSLMTIQRMFERVEESILNLRQSPLSCVDPVSMLAILFVVLVRHTDHPGFSEISAYSDHSNASMGSRTKNQNVNEIVCHVLMQPQFELLRNAMFANETESKLFKKVVNKAITVSDIFDIYARPSQITALRGPQFNSSLIVEYIMRVSTLSHTMQPWSTCSKWSGRLCQEMQSAYEAGLLACSQKMDWDVKECEVYEHVVIPLLHAGVEPSCIERIENVQANKFKWINEGKVTVEGFVESHQRTMASK